MRARLMLSCAVAVACLSWGGGTAFGYAGEQGTVGTGITPATVSTHHLHLTRALAYCAGFDANLEIPNPVSPSVITQAQAKEAEIIAIYDELTDQGSIYDSTTTWTNIVSPWTYEFPPAETADCRAKAPAMVYPLLEESPPPGSNLPPDSLWNQREGWFTNRFGPWAANFHFPTDSDLQTMRTFALNKSSDPMLSARTVYGFGPADSNMWTGSCYTTPYQTNLNTGMTAGSLQALGTYLHSLGDSYSHGECHDNWPPDYRPPWYYHTQANTDQNVEACAFNSHSLEFGCPSSSEMQSAFERNVVDGGLEVFKTLLEYGGKHGKPARLKTVDAHEKWLSRQLERYASLFKTNTFAEAGACRVNFAYDLMQICTTAATTASQECLSDVAVRCSPDGQVGPCSPTPLFPITPACSGSAQASTTSTR